MSTSTACSHRWVVVEYVQTADDPDDMDFEFVAINSCRAVDDYVTKRREDPLVLGIEAMGTRAKHFEEWLDRYADEEDEGPDDESR